MEKAMNHRRRTEPTQTEHSASAQACVKHSEVAIKNPSDTDAESVVGRVFAILGAFTTVSVLGISELARITGIPRTSVHRLVHQMVDQGALSAVGAKFRVGPTLFELGQLHFPQKLRELLQPFLDDLQRITGHDVALVELISYDVIVVAASLGRTSTAVVGHVGQRLPAHATSGGLLLLDIESRMPPRPLVSLTTQTLVDPARLRQRFAVIKAARVSIEHGEAEFGRSSVSVQVLNRHKRVLGALMVSGKTNQFDVEVVTATLASFSPVLTAAGRRAGIGFLASARPRVFDEQSTH
jgi:IclR family transcriptional regulator, acetate operon repressor